MHLFCNAVLFRAVALEAVLAAATDAEAKSSPPVYFVLPPMSVLAGVAAGNIEMLQWFILVIFGLAGWVRRRRRHAQSRGDSLESWTVDVPKPDLFLAPAS